MTLRWRVATETVAATAASLCQKTRGDGGRTVTAAMLFRNPSAQYTIKSCYGISVDINMSSVGSLHVLKGIGFLIIIQMFHSGLFRKPMFDTHVSRQLGLQCDTTNRIDKKP